MPEILNRPSWHTRAACHGHLELFFPTQGANFHTIRAACKVCETCPVLPECARWVMTLPPDTQGVWAGMTHKQRDQLREIPEIRRKYPPILKAKRGEPECGTSAGYARHRRAGERPCADCTEAERLRSRQNRPNRDLRAQYAPLIQLLMDTEDELKGVC